MTITADVLYKGCLTASIAHAIMTNVYPELSYEQSWDGGNYSLQDTAGMLFFISGLMAIVGEWLKDDCRDSIERIVSGIRLCVRK